MAIMKYTPLVVHSYLPLRIESFLAILVVVGLQSPRRENTSDKLMVAIIVHEHVIRVKQNAPCNNGAF